MGRLWAVLLFLLCWVSAYLLVEASRWWHRPPTEEPVMSPAYAAKLAQQRDRLRSQDAQPSFSLESYRGGVLVVCAAGAEGRETESWLRQLAELEREGLPQGVELLWLGVGSEVGEVVELARRLALPFPAQADPLGSAVAHFDHWLDPTLYVVGKWGAVRYAGELEPTQLAQMLQLLAEEPEEGLRRFFSSRGVDVGHRAPEFSLPDLEGRAVSLGSLVGSARLVCLLFVESDLSIGTQATDWLEGLIEEVGSARLKGCVVYSLLDSETLRRAYREHPMGEVYVLSDERGEVAHTYRVEDPPLALLLDAQGVVCQRGGTPNEISAAIAALLQGASYPRPVGPTLLPP